MVINVQPQHLCCKFTEEWRRGCRVMMQSSNHWRTILVVSSRCEAAMRCTDILQESPTHRNYEAPSARLRIAIACYFRWMQSYDFYIAQNENFKGLHTERWVILDLF